MDAPDNSGPTNAMDLRRFPVEILLMVAKELGRSDLTQFTRTSKHIRKHTFPLLLSDVCLLSSDGFYLTEDRPDPDPLVEHATSVTVASPLPEYTLETGGTACLSCHRTPFCPECPGHPLLPGLQWDKIKDTHVTAALKRCPENKLKKFAWLMGNCLQEPILGSRGIISTRQTKLEEIRLVTSHDISGLECHTFDCIGLTPFTCLQSLAWVGIHPSQMDILATALTQHAPRLVHLELDFLTGNAENFFERLNSDDSDESDDDNDGDASFITTADVEEHDIIAGTFGKLVLGLIPKGSRVAFPRLKSLSLTNASLHDRESRLSRPLNFVKLEAVRLCWCRGLDSFVLNWNYLGSPLGEDSAEEDDDWVYPDSIDFALRSIEVQVSLDAYTSFASASFAHALRICVERSPVLEELIFYARSRRAPHEAVAPYLYALDLSYPPCFTGLVYHIDCPGEGWTTSDMPDVFKPCRLYDAIFKDWCHPPPSGQFNAEFLAYSNLPHRLADDDWPRPDTRYATCLSREKLVGIHIRQNLFSHHLHYSRAVGFALPDDNNGGGANLLKRMLTRYFYKFVSDLFTSGKFPSLRFVAYGDFTCSDPRARVLLCRSEAWEETRGGSEVCGCGEDTEASDAGEERYSASSADEEDEEEEGRPAPMRLVNENDHDIISLLDKYMRYLVAGPHSSRKYDRPGHASQGFNAWQPGLATKFARESGRPAATVPGGYFGPLAGGPPVAWGGAAKG